ncbi:SHOCT domain-containing protein [uncultured Clostridium sp.]|uniref:SHOCT domain-containing protein n=1 Tax=uncultured Clostridium sp. TaxID=59620 RepID=UPI0025CDE5C2|nr:SHOCT domain-containing protein [uncultured Clostridium sp.]
MNEKVITLKSTKLMGILICSASGLSLLSFLFSMIILSDGFYFVNFLYLIQILAIGAIGVYFILKDNYQNIEIIVPISLFIIAAKGIIASFIYSSFSLLSFLEAGCYAAIGFIIIDNLKKVKIANIITLILIVYNILNAYFIGNVQSLYIRYGFYSGLNVSLVSTGYTGLVFLLVLLTYFSNYTNKKDIKVKQYKSHIKLNTEIIDFKTLLEFVENQYKNGEITEEEYKKKRTEILNQL